MKLKTALWLGFLLWVLPAFAGDVSLPSQTARQELHLYESDGSRKTSGSARAYMDGADSSDVDYQIDLTFSAAGACSCWYAGDTTGGGDQYRDVRVDVYSTDGSDSLVLDNYLLHGRWVGKDAVDGTAIAIDAVNGSKILDRTLQAADADTGAWTTLEVLDNTLTGDDISTGADLSVNSVTAGDVYVGDSLTVGTVVAAPDVVASDDVIAADLVQGADVTATDDLIALDDLAVTDDASIGGRFAQTSNTPADSSWFKQLLTAYKGVEVPTGYGLRFRQGANIMRMLCGDIGSGDGTFDFKPPITQGSAYEILFNQGSGQWGWAALDSTYVAPGALSPTDIAADGAAPNDALTYNGTKWDPLAWEDSWRRRPYYFCDFTAPLTTGYLAIPFWYGGAINSGSLVSNRPPTPNHPGVVSQRAGLGADSGYYLLCATGAFEMGGGECFEASLNVETTANTTVYLGLHDATTASAPVDGAYIRIVGTTLDGQTAGASSVTTTGTSYTITIATFYRLRIVTNAAASRVDFYLWNDAGTLLWTNFNTTNLPSGSGQTFGSGCTAHNAAGGSAYLVQIDYFAQWWGRALTR